MQSKYLLCEITDISELAESLSKYHPEQTVEESLEILEKHFVFGYKGYDGVAKGFVYALNVDNAYFIDGCNDGIGLFFSASVGKMVRDKLFKEHTDKIFCIYPSDNKHSHILCKRIGFTEISTEKNLTLFCLNKE